MDRPHHRIVPLALVLASTVLAVPGCAKRHQLGDSDLPKAGSESVTEVRVFTNRRTVAIYEQAKTPAAGETVYQRKMVVGRNTRGAVVGEDTVDGKRRLWVTFDPTCTTTECAYGFAADGGRYVLSSLPAIEGFAAPELDADVYLLVDETTATTASLPPANTEG